MKTKFSLERETHRHKKYLVYMQILAALCLAILASDYFKLLEIRASFFFVEVNNAILALIVGFVGFYYLREQIGKIEDTIGDNTPK